jgi:type III restriction enzyme
VKLGGAYEMSLFEDLESYEDAVIPIERSIYDHAICDSKPEKDFARALDEMEEVRLFFKLPGWFKVPTPIGEYRPDWAVLCQIQDAFGDAQEKLYLVCETKGSLDELERRGRENLRIECARRHFGVIEVGYGDVTSAEEFRERFLRRGD